jgi:hypothetical protein
MNHTFPQCSPEDLLQENQTTGLTTQSAGDWFVKEENEKLLWT